MRIFSIQALRTRGAGRLEKGNLLIYPSLLSPLHSLRGDFPGPHEPERAIVAALVIFFSGFSVLEGKSCPRSCRARRD
jgi:hypothetical protein